MNYTEILTQIQESINWIVFLLVIASGYFVRVTPVLKTHSTTLKILILSLFVAGLYVYFNKTKIDTAIVGYFVAFGFHTAVLKLLERKFVSLVGLKTEKTTNEV